VVKQIRTVKNRVRRPVILLIAAALGCAGTGRPQSVDLSAGVDPGLKQTLASFLIAFDNLDWPSFRKFFAPDATVFHPAAPNLKRIDSPEEVEKAWLGVFARIRKTSGRTAPPYMNLQPQDLKVQMLSGDVALVTFHLTEGNVLSRRTIVFRRDPGGWKIVHLHASNLPLGAP
jgi:ketosteroid isomerase-like protein